VRELETRLADKSRLADSYESERKQRMELESKFQQLNKDQSTQLANLKADVRVNC
jgi:hypothetical protein